METVAARVATIADVERMSEAMARAFYDDPIMMWAIPDDTKRMQVQRPMYRAMFGAAISRRYADVFTTKDAVAAALWMRPDKPKPPFAAMPALLVPMLRNARHMKIGRLMSAMQTLQKRHPKEPKHWYLAGIGTDPDFQGRGIATALMRPVLERCDAERLPAYLETQKERNVPFYEHRGFVVTGELDLPKGGPHMWLMWREPKA